ncbi:acyl-CoA dehydrogenase family protein [Phyllobacterium lublinensis]|uniref:acyl-CoA dehydrogenase family protein n=1 Tax=Phyllobacterium lublinensis TaxID=2875708 RepID=UPI001CCF22BD|nr:acyl-CoA dehydrogenase family protein [Phyllobacterium sp. 2063]MBZ9655250.1 acyl-CoA dehydrogenase family protein [Phyllobacterium sp. 2063]
MRDLFSMVIRLAEADSNIAHILRNHFVFVERFAQRPNSDQQAFWQHKVAEGAIFGLANAERAKAQTGDDSVTRLAPKNGGYLLNGVKFYSTGSLYSDFIIVRAKDQDERQVTVIIPTEREGITLVDDWDAAGQRLTGTGTTRFEDVRVEAAEVILDAEGTAYNLPYASTLPQLFLTAINAGILYAVLRDAKALIRQRSKKAFYHAPAELPREDPLLLKIIGDISAHAFASQSVVLAAADAQDAILAARENGEPAREVAHEGSLQAVKAKILVDALTLQAATSLFDVGGASSTQRSHNLDRHWRNARTVSAHNPGHYKALAIGNLELNDAPLPSVGFF